MSLRIGILGSILLFAAPAAFTQETTAPQGPLTPRSTQDLSAPDVAQPSHGQLSLPASSQVTDNTERDEQQALLQKKCAELDQLTQEIAQLRSATGTAQQILVHVQLLEIPLTKLRQLGVDASWIGERGVDVQKMPDVADTIVGHVKGQSAEAVQKVESKLAQPFMDALKRQGLAKTLAQSTVATVSGRQASVHVGGEFPIPTGSDANAPLEFRNFGTDLRIVALALGNNQVRLDVNAGVSTVDDSRAVEISGVRVPGLKTSSCETRVELSFGEAAMLGGLVQQRAESRQLDGGRIETEVVEVGLLIVVTPELVAPNGP